MLCATATSLAEMVLFRALQGVGGAFIVPLAQATLFDINPRDKQGQAMALFGGGVMIGPILGPVLGGWLTDNYNWRWVFLVNLPVGIICALLMLRFMPKTETHQRKFDLFGFALLGIALGALQLFLDRGQQNDWFQSWETIIELGVAIAAGWMFIVQMMTAKHPLFDRSMFADRNFATGLVFMAVTGVLLLAGLALLPPLLQTLYGYSVLQSGFLTAPRGVGTLISMLLAGRLVGKVDSRLLVGIGVVLMGVSLYMMTGFAIDQPAQPVITSGVVQGLGLGLIFVPLQTLAFETLATRMRTTAAALLNLSRNIGGSIGISVVSTQLVRMTQVAHADLARNITEQTIPTLNSPALQAIAPQGAVALAFINGEITRQALFIAYLDDFKLMMIITFAVLPLLLLMKRGRKQGAPIPPAWRWNDGVLAIRCDAEVGKPGIGGWRTGADGREELEVRVAEAPADGAANEAVAKLLAKALGVSRSKVAIISGLTSRNKRVATPFEPGEIRRRLGG